MNDFRILRSRKRLENREYGVVYLAFGPPYLVLAYNSIASLKAVSPEIPVCVVVDKKTSALIRTPPDGWSSEDAFLVVDESIEQNRYVKTSLNQYSPFDKTLFLDADTVVTDDISEVFSYLESFDLCIRLYGSGPKRGVTRSALPLLDGRYQVSDLPHWNSGVIAFKKCEEVDVFFSSWNAAYDIHRREMQVWTDQGALVEAIFRTKARVLSLDSRWNCLTSERSYFVNPDNRVIHNCYFKWSDRLQFKKIWKSKFERLDALQKSQVARFLHSQERKRRRKFVSMLRLLWSVYVSRKDWV